jgi:hypothetical protein
MAGTAAAPVMSAAVDSAAALVDSAAVAADGAASIVKNAIKTIWGDASGTSPRIHYL